MALFSNAAYAEPPKFPVGDKEVIDQKEVRCYDIDGYKALLWIYEGLKSELETNKILNVKIWRQSNTIDQAILALDLQLNIISSLKTDNKKLFEDWKEENRKRHLAENKPMLGSWIPWAIAAGLAVTSTTLGIVVVLR